MPVDSNGCQTLVLTQTDNVTLERKTKKKENERRDVLPVKHWTC